LNCIKAYTCETWQFPIAINDCCVCPENYSFIWEGYTKTSLEENCKNEILEKTVIEDAGIARKQKKEKFAYFSFIIADILTKDKIFAFNIDGFNFLQYTGDETGVDGYFKYLKNSNEIVDVERSGNSFTVFLCKKYCNKSISVYGGYNPKALSVANVILTSCNVNGSGKIGCGCNNSKQVSLVVKTPAMEGMWDLYAIDKEGTRTLIYQNINTVSKEKSGYIKDSTIVVYSNEFIR
jgi:hypothetical protein